MFKSDVPAARLTDTGLYHATQENLFALFRVMAHTLAGSELVETPTLSYHHCFPTNPMFKGVWRTRLLAGDADEAIEQTLAWFRERGAPYVFWWTGPGSTPDDLPERLQARGLLDMAGQMQELAAGIRQTEQGAPCMVADLFEVNEALVERAPPGFLIREVSDAAMLEDFKQVFVETYEIPDWAGQAWVDAALHIGIGATPWRMFVGYLDDDPVATALLFNGAGVASVYAVATLPRAQGRGIGAAITLSPLLDAREAGYRYAVLFSTEMGVSVYRRIGFRMLEARLNRYLWQNR